MCKKDTSGGGKKCCTRTVISGVVMLVGAALLVASFVIAAVVLTMLQDGVNNTARYNSPQTDETAFNDFLSNIPEKRSTNDASLRYYAYYLFNITNLDTLVTTHTTSPVSSRVIPVVAEMGPYVYRKWVDKFNVQFDAAQDKISWQEYGRYFFQPEYSKMGSRQLNDETDMFYQASSIYTALFANPLGPATKNQPEIAFRLGLAAAFPYVYTGFINSAVTGAIGSTIFNASLFNPSTQDPAIIHMLTHSTFKTTPFGDNTKSAFLALGAGLYPSNPTKWAAAPTLELWKFLAESGIGSFALPSDTHAMLLAAGPALASVSGLPSVSGVSCSNMQLLRSGGQVAFCYLFLPTALITNSINNALTAASIPLSFTTDNIDGVKAWLNHILHNQYNWVFEVMGHQAGRFKDRFAGSCQALANPDLALSTVTSDPACRVFNNGNMWVLASAKSLLFENMHLLGPLLAAAKAPAVTLHPTRLSYFSNSTSQADAALDREVNQVGTGINHIGDVDNIYKFKNTSVLPTTGSSAPWCHQAIDPVYAPAGLYHIQRFQQFGQTFQQVTQAEATKYSPNYPPGRVDDSNPFKYKSSVIEDRSFPVSVFVSDITRRAKMVWYSDISLKGIDLRRYTISDEEFVKIPFFGQYYDGLANYTCPAAGGPTTFACLPRYQKVNQTDCDIRGGFEFATLAVPTDADFNRDAPFGANFFLASELLPFIDFEPTSGAAMAGTLKMQLNLMVTPYVGATAALYPAGAESTWLSTGPRRTTVIPSVWLSKIAFLSDKQADKFKSTVQAAQLASKVVLIVGTIVGGVMMFAGLAFFIVNVRKGGAYGSQTSKSDLAL